MGLYFGNGNIADIMGVSLTGFCAVRYDTIELTWTRKLSNQLYLAHVGRTRKPSYRWTTL